MSEQSEQPLTPPPFRQLQEQPNGTSVASIRPSKSVQQFRLPAPSSFAGLSQGEPGGALTAPVNPSSGKRQFRAPMIPFIQVPTTSPTALPETPLPNGPATPLPWAVKQFKVPSVSQQDRYMPASLDMYPTQRVPAFQRERKGIGTIEEYSTAIVPAYKPPLPLFAKIGLYSLCILASACGIGVGIFLLQTFYPSSSVLLYIDFFSMMGILLSTLFASVARYMRREYTGAQLFTFRQARSSSSGWGKAGEYLFYFLAFSCSFSLLLASASAPGNTAYPLLLSFALGCGYMIFLKPGMAKWIVWMVVSPWYRTRTVKKPPSALLYHPFVSVLIPAWNEEVGILSTMRSILTSQYSPLELIVINDGSTDTSDQKIRAFIEEHSADFPGKTMVYHYQPNAGKSSALNQGIQMARGEIIITTDADCVMHPMCITYLVGSLSDPGVMGCTGDYRVGNVHTLLGRIQAIEYAIGFYTRKADSLFGTVFVMSGTVSAFRRTVFERIGMFHTENITEDLEITMRMHKAGMRVVSEPRAIVYTESPIRLRDLFRQRLRWVRGTLDAFGEHSDFLFSRRREHGKMHSWIVLPLIRLNHFSVILQILCKYTLLIFCLVTHQYTTLAIAMILIAVIVAISLLSSKDYRETALLSPIAWILLEIPNCVYAIAFLQAWWNYLRKKRQTWQRWNREGILT